MSKRPPLDDAGIAVDQMLEVCSSIVNQLHKQKDTEKSSQELRDNAMTLDILWNLTRDIIEFDIATSEGMDEDFGEGPEGFGEPPRGGPGLPPSDLDG